MIETDYEVLVIGAGVAGICQIKKLQENGIKSLVLEAGGGLGGTWYNNRYPGCRFDSESYTYGYAFSRDLLDSWHWKELFSPQPENLKYLNFVADKFDLHKHIRLNAAVEAMCWNEAQRQWSVTLASGEVLTSQFVITCTGALGVPTLPSYPGMDDFEGPGFHSYNWPHTPLDLAGKRVGVIGTGASGIQIIADIADEVGALTVFQRRPNWSVPLNNREISEAEMADIRRRYDAIFATCAKSNGGFDHLPDRRGYETVSVAERRALWDSLYDAPGFALLLANFPETFLDARANRDLSDYVAERIRARVHDPDVADRLIPKDHGFGMRRMPMETGYFEAYNRDNVELVSLLETPIERVTPTGVETSAANYDFDVLVYATGFDVMTGAFDKIDIKGVDGDRLKDKWIGSPTTYLGIMVHRFPNMLMVAGPQSVSGSTNYPRAIEVSVDWVTGLLTHARATGVSRIEAQSAAETEWTKEVIEMQENMPFSKVKSWFTGYNSNIHTRDAAPRYVAYWGGAPRYTKILNKVSSEGFADIQMD
ncbi:MAG: NAD(P)/FAD-dependent oxidoreductase [PS1 clade bacterium]|nr:NAD(P)/FAD-dependent oxidoreductase [PS1 clade bacterium]